MAVLAIFAGPGITKEMYETLRTEIKWERNLPPGSMIHASAFDSAGHLHVADVWESAEALNDFVNNRLMPTMKQHKIPAPAVSVYPLHNLDVFPVAQKHMVK